MCVVMIAIFAGGLWFFLVLIVCISLWDCLYCLVYLCYFGLRLGLFGCSSFHCSNLFFECLDSLDCVYCFLDLFGLFALCAFFDGLD